LCAKNLFFTLLVIHIIKITVGDLQFVREFLYFCPRITNSNIFYEIYEYGEKNSDFVVGCDILL